MKHFLTQLLIFAALPLAVFAAQPKSSIPVKTPPVSIEDPSQLVLGKMPDGGKRNIQVQIKNSSQNKVFIKTVRSGCPCIAISSSGTNTLDANATLLINAVLDASEIAPGPFSKKIFVDIKDFGSYPISFTGEIIPMVLISPAPAIDLGTFAGTSAWTREWTFTSSFPDDKLILKQPADNPLFTFHLKKTSPKQYTLAVTPKTPLPKQKLEENIEIPVEGVDNYKALKVKLLGTVTGMQLYLSNTKILLPKSKLKPGEAPVFQVLLSPFSPKSRARQRASKEQGMKSGEAAEGVAFLPAAKDEEKLQPMNEFSTWKKIADDIKIHIPGNPKIEKVPSVTGLNLIFTFPAGYFTDTRRKTKGQLFINDSVISSIEFACY